MIPLENSREYDADQYNFAALYLKSVYDIDFVITDSSTDRNNDTIFVD